MNEERIQQVLSIEKEAHQIHEAAVRDADQLLMLANQEVEMIIEKAQKKARQDAQKLVAGAQEKEQGTLILSAMEEKIKQAINTAKGNFEPAVSYVLNRALGKE